jgi:hypothetical protein
MINDAEIGEFPDKIKSLPGRKKNLGPQVVAMLRDDKSYGQICKALHLAHSTVQWHAEKNGLARQPKGLKWSIEDTAELRSWYGLISCADLGQRLGKTRNMVIGKAHRMGLGLCNFAVCQPTPDPFPPPSSCLFGIGDPHKPGFRFCGEPVTERRSNYCSEHAERCRLKTGSSVTEISAA